MKQLFQNLKTGETYLEEYMGKLGRFAYFQIKLV
jgi:hypothetical protein